MRGVRGQLRAEPTFSLVKHGESVSGVGGIRMSRRTEDTLEFMNAATISLLRHVATGPTSSRLEVLLGQNCVKNWLRSTIDKEVIMRYPGEWKIPGGAVDSCDTSIEETATRELREEYIGVTASDPEISLHLINKKLTKPIKGRQYLMHNFVAMEDDNPWITATDLASTINQNLQNRFGKFNQRIEDGSYWSLSDEDKSQLSPELVRVEWMPIDIAIEQMGSSLDDRLICVNTYQRSEFEKYNIHARDPMFQSMVTLMDIKKLGTLEAMKVQDTIMRTSNEDPSYYS